MTRPLGAVEVPIVGSDSIRWIEVTVPCASPPSSSEPRASPTESAASCHAIGDPPVYLIWRIHSDLPHALELLELSCCKDFPKAGLRLIFSDSLFPFAFVCRNEVGSIGNAYLLYTVTVSGIAYLFRLQNICDFDSGSIFPQDELIEFDLHIDPQRMNITCIAAASGCLVIGRHDGVISCYGLGVLDMRSPDFVQELRDDVGMGRLWSLMSRAKVSASVRSLVVLEVNGRKLLFVIHADGNLRAWDLVGRVKVLSCNINMLISSGSGVLRVWVGDACYDSSLIPMAISCRSNAEANKETIVIYHIHFSSGDKINLSAAPPTKTVHLEEGRLIDLKITCKKLWVLKEDGSMFYNLLHDDVNVEVSYGLQEAFVADQLFQDSGYESSDLMGVAYSIFSSLKDHIAPFVSSIFIRRLLHPGVRQNAALLATIKALDKHMTEFEFRSLTIDGLKKKLCSIIDSQVVADNPFSVSHFWKNFCKHYFHHWRQNSVPYGLFQDSSKGAVGLIRKNSISVFRSLEDIELLIHGCYRDYGDFLSLELALSADGLDREILYLMLRCTGSISRQLGKAAVAAFYETLLGSQPILSDDLISRLLKILESGYGSSNSTSFRLQYGADPTWEKELADHRNQRKFSVEILLSLSNLKNTAKSWCIILDALEKYLEHHIPHKCLMRSHAEERFNIGILLLSQAASQVARVMMNSAFDMLMLLGYLIRIGGQVQMDHEDISRIQLRLIPMVHKILMQWLIIHMMGTTPSESHLVDDFSLRLSSLHIDNTSCQKSCDGKLGSYDFTLACMLSVNCVGFIENQGQLSSSFPNPYNIMNSVRNLCSWIIWGVNGFESLSFFTRAIDLASILVKYGQYEAVEILLVTLDAYLHKENILVDVQSHGKQRSVHLHLLGFCLLVRAHRESNGIIAERKIREAVRCFFRAACGQGAWQALQHLTFQTGLTHSVGVPSVEAGKLHYYQVIMQIFEQYNMSEGACQFALAALEQVDEVLKLEDGASNDSFPESATSVRGRLWANVFKFTLDLKRYRDAYCAIISNPDEDTKYICLRRFLIVLCEHGAIKVLCDGELPFVGLLEKVERELAWKAERSDIMAKPNLYKLLYSFEMYRQNWRKAASYMYQYSIRMKMEAPSKENLQPSFALQERMHALSAAINALNLVCPAYDWIDSSDSYISPDQHAPNKRARRVVEGSGFLKEDEQLWKNQFHADIGKLENEYVLTWAEYLLVIANIKLPFVSVSQAVISDMVDLLIQGNLYDMAFTVLLKFWKDSGLKRELERVFVAISQECCPNRRSSLYTGTNNLLLMSSEVESGFLKLNEMSSARDQTMGNSAWEKLALYLDKYRKLHPRLPVTVAETLLHGDREIELPLWLVHIFKGGRKPMSWGMTGLEPDPASLFRLYVDYGRFTEATNLLLEYMESFSFSRPADIINRKKMSAVWFPYTAIERLWCLLEDSRKSGHMVDQYEKLQNLLHGALLNHLKQVKIDSDDVMSSALH